MENDKSIKKSFRDRIPGILRDFEVTRKIGEIEVTLPSPPKKEEIANYNIPKVEQKFRYTEQPKKGQEPSEEFLSQEIYRLKNGYWFFNNGNLEYITGWHYALLNYSSIDGERPIFTDSQRDFFLVWDAVEKDPNCFGLCLTTSRRWGKGEVAIIIAYMRTIMSMYKHCGIQSKTNDDAKGMFLKLVQRWQRFPVFMKPLDEGTKSPKSELRFFEPSTTSRKETVKEYKEAINSWIDFKSTVKGAYDGYKLHTYIMDEAAKNPPDCDPYETWDIVKFCLLNGSKIIGKALITTTVESTESFTASQSYKRMWDDSNPNEKKPNGRTTSGLYRYYNPGYMGYYGTDENGISFIDEYGYSRQELTKEFILRGREGLSGNKLSSQIRKLSLTVTEAFMSDGEKCYFNAHNIENQKTWLKEYAPKSLVRRITFFRRENGEVDWRHDEKGCFQMVWDFPDKKMANKHSKKDGFKSPTNTDFGSIGVDPYSFTETVSGKQSMGVAYMFIKGNPLDPENSNFAAIRYADRPPRKSIFYDNICMMAEYFGVKINYEADINDFIEYYENIGKHHYLMTRPKSSIDPNRRSKSIKKQIGTLSKDQFALQRHFDLVNLYVEDHCEKIYFMELLDDLLRYDHYKRTKSDDTVAFGMALLGSSELLKVIKQQSKLQIIKVYNKPKTLHGKFNIN